MKAYVATKYEFKDRAREVMLELSRAGHTISYDWTVNEQISPVQAMADLRGVYDADFLVVIFEKDAAYKGSFVELGAALALGKPVYALGHAMDLYQREAGWGGCLFLAHPNVHREDVYRRDILGETHS